MLSLDCYLLASRLCRVKRCFIRKSYEVYSISCDVSIISCDIYSILCYVCSGCCNVCSKILWCMCNILWWKPPNKKPKTAKTRITITGTCIYALISCSLLGYNNMIYSITNACKLYTVHLKLIFIWKYIYLPRTFFCAGRCRIIFGPPSLKVRPDQML